jgi:hypothetical protein
MRFSLFAVIAGALLVTASAAATTMPATGALTFTSAVLTLERTAGPNSFFSQTNTGVMTGTFTGSFTTEIRIVVHADGSDEFVGTRTCTCTVGGASGTVVFRLVGHGIFGGAIDGTFTVLSADGGLDGLHGHATFTGVFGSTTYAGKIEQ